MGTGPIWIPMHLGLIDRPFVPHVRSWEPCDFIEVTNGPQAYTLDILRLQKEEAQVGVSERGQGLTFTQNVG